MKRLLAALLGTIVGALSWAQPLTVADHDIGFIFNTDNLLFDQESYRGGMGVKLRGDPLAYRGLVDLYVSTISSARAFDVGVGVEYHFVPDRVSPYAGGEIAFGLTRSTENPNPSTTQRVRTSQLQLAGIAGVEVHVTPFLALFLEYNLALSYEALRTVTDVAGNRDIDRTDDWTLETGLGNESKLGVVIYFNRNRELPWEARPATWQD